jgi:hypothetical protein
MVAGGREGGGGRGGAPTHAQALEPRARQGMGGRAMKAPAATTHSRITKIDQSHSTATKQKQMYNKHGRTKELRKKRMDKRYEREAKPGEKGKDKAEKGNERGTSTDMPTYLPTCLPACPPTYLLTYPYLPTYLKEESQTVTE